MSMGGQGTRLRSSRTLKTVQPGARQEHSYRTVLWKANTNSYTLYRMALFSVTFRVTLTTQNHPILILCIAFHIFVLGGDRDFNFAELVNRIASASPWMAKYPSKGSIVRSREPCCASYTEFCATLLMADD